jgi:hypothetical protein
LAAYHFDIRFASLAWLKPMEGGGLLDAEVFMRRRNIVGMQHPELESKAVGQWKPISL